MEQGRLERRKRAERDDVYVPLPEQGVDWAAKNRGPLLIGGVAVIVLVLAAVIAGVLYSNRSAKAAVAFGAAMQTYQTPLAAPGQQVPPGLKTYPTVAARAQVATAQFKAVADQYGMTPDGKNARYFEGLTEMEAGQNASAQATFEKVSGGWNKDLASLAKLALAQMYGQTGKDGQAATLYQELTKKPTRSVPAGTAQLELAGLYEMEGKTDQARQIYAELKDKDPKGQAGLIAAQKLNPQAAAGPALGGAPQS